MEDGEHRMTLSTRCRKMLVLSRKEDEKIIIGDSITLMVVSIQGDKVRLGIDAPKDVSIHREEVYRAIHKDESTLGRQPEAH